MKIRNTLLRCPPIALAAMASLAAAQPTTSFPWGSLELTDTVAELHVRSIPQNRTVGFPRLNNSCERIFLKGDPSKTALAFKPEVTEWFVTLPDSTESPAVVVIETVGPPRLLAAPFLNQPAEDGTYTLPAHHAVVHGEKLRYEPQPHKNTIGYWTVETDWCEWRLNAPQDGRYTVHVLQGCGKGQGGSEVQFELDGSRARFAVEDTGHFQNFKDRAVGILNITRPGEHTLRLRALHKAKAAVMDVREVRLLPRP